MSCGILSQKNTAGAGWPMAGRVARVTACNLGEAIRRQGGSCRGSEHGLRLGLSAPMVNLIYGKMIPGGRQVQTKAETCAIEVLNRRIGHSPSRFHRKTSGYSNGLVNDARHTDPLSHRSLAIIG